MNILPRAIFRQAVDLMAEYPTLAILGPRQIGKTTLARQLSNAISVRLRYSIRNSCIWMSKINHFSSILARGTWLGDFRYSFIPKAR